MTSYRRPDRRTPHIASSSQHAAISSQWPFTIASRNFTQNATWSGSVPGTPRTVPVLGTGLEIRTGALLAVFARRQAPTAHVMELAASGNVLGEDRGLDTVEHPLEPADELRLSDAELGLGG